MKRLTKKELLAGHAVAYVGDEDCFDVWSVPKKFMCNAVDRLAAYEETGLEPEEIKNAYQEGWKKAIDTIAYEEQAGTILVENPLLAEYVKLGPLDRLRELAQADWEGRCVVLPRLEPRLEPGQGDPPGEPGPPGPPGIAD